MRTLILFFLFASAFIVKTSAQQAIANPNTYHVTFKLYDGEALIGQPQFVMREGSYATITSAKPNGYSLRAKLEAYGAKPGMHSIEAEIYRVEGGVWKRIGSPVISAPLDQSVTVSLAQSNKPAFRMMFSINSKFSGKLAAAVDGRPNACSAAKLANWQSTMLKPVVFVTNAVQNPELGKCCSAGCNQTCCSDGPICCSDLLCPNSGCCT